MKLLSSPGPDPDTQDDKKNIGFQGGIQDGLQEVVEGGLGRGTPKGTSKPQTGRTTCSTL